MTKPSGVIHARIAALHLAALSVAISGALLCAPSRAARADDGVRARHESSVFWRRVTQPDAARAAALLEAARGWLDVSAALPGGGWATACPTLDGSSARLVRERLVKRAVATENAIARLDLAREITPDDTEVLFTLALAISAWERPEHGCTVSRRDTEALALWRALRSVDASFEPEMVGTELALVQTRLGDLESAIGEYQALVELTAHAPRRAMLAHGNLAELLMMKGELRPAVAHYEMATRFAREVDDTGALALAELGLAAALDRLGEHSQALTIARQAVDRSDDSMRVLRSDGVFFVPAYEVHYYEALAHESRADGTRVPLAAARARGTRAESLSASVERALASPLSREELRELALALVAWLRASAEVPSAETTAAELTAGRALALSIESVLARNEARRRALREARAAAPLRVIDADLDEAPDGGPPPEARARLRVGCLTASARSWRRYLDEGGRDGLSADGARRHLVQLAQQIAAVDEPTRGPRRRAR